MAKPAFDVVVAGTGACGLSAARYLRLLDPSLKVALVGMHAPMGHTSSMSAECFRDHWPSGVMRNFMRRSIALLQQFADRSVAFKLHKHGYLYVSTAADKAAVLRQRRQQRTGRGESSFGGAELRCWRTPEGMDCILPAQQCSTALAQCTLRTPSSRPT
jgi:glycine/D-amino acid oxidase-like deaminating enzyme